MITIRLLLVLLLVILLDACTINRTCVPIKGSEYAQCVTVIHEEVSCVGSCQHQKHHAPKAD